MIEFVKKLKNALNGVNNVAARKREMTVGPTWEVNPVFWAREEKGEGWNPKEERRDVLERKRVKIEREKAI